MGPALEYLWRLVNCTRSRLPGRLELCAICSLEAGSRGGCQSLCMVVIQAYYLGFLWQWHDNGFKAGGNLRLEHGDDKDGHKCSCHLVYTGAEDMARDPSGPVAFYWFIHLGWWRGCRWRNFSDLLDEHGIYWAWGGGMHWCRQFCPTLLCIL